MSEGYTDVEINPFAASEGLLKGLPADWDPKLMQDRLAKPASRRDLVDYVTAQSALNVTIMAALVSIWQKRDSELTNQLGDLIGQVQQMSEMSATLILRMVTDSDEVVRDQADASSSEENKHG